MNIENTKTVLRSAITSRTPMLTTGQPGIGKTQICEHVAAETGHDCLILQPGLLDKMDLMGLPITKGGRLVRCLDDLLESIFAAPRPLVVVLDELGQADNDQQSACAPLLWSRSIGQRKMPEHVAVVATANRVSDRAGSHPILTQILSRFGTVVNLDVDPVGWSAWAAQSGLHYAVQSFIAASPKNLCNFVATEHYANQQAFACPRSWAQAAKILDWNLPQATLPETISGCIGPAMAPAFVAHTNLLASQINIPKIIAGQSWKFPSEVAAQLAFSMGVGACANADTAQRVLGIAQDIYRLKHHQYAMMAVSHALIAYPEITDDPAWDNLVSSELGKLIRESRSV